MSDTNRPWTPGPWVVGEAPNGADDIDRSAMVYAEGKWRDGRGFCIADCDDTGEATDAEERANAYLIAAAPELYEALAAFVGVCDNGTPTKFIEELGSVVPAARAALAKARGEEVAS